MSILSFHKCRTSGPVIACQPILLALLWMVSSAAFAQIHHTLAVRLDPEGHRLAVVDQIELPANRNGPIEFHLHADLEPTVVGEGAKLQRIDTRQVISAPGTSSSPEAGGLSVERFAVTLPDTSRQFTVKYAGELFHPIETHGEEYARSFGRSPGLISSAGVYLAGSSYWYPHVDDELVTFSLQVTVPSGWRSISQGRRTAHVEERRTTQETWVIDKPQEEIYLVAGALTKYRQPAGNAEAMVFLREPDRSLAQRYLAATAQYLELYSHLIGPYPYAKFALVENFWETGYGMPSFTLLGSTVIRLPFIVHSSYPHEILHNWWGNGVYVDYRRGNWAEGLTSYLADHLLKEQRGEAVAYRRATLQKYTDYVQTQRDFPLTAFRGRHSSVTEAVGYGKALMLFHMLRQQLGDTAFIEGLRQLYRRHQLQAANFDDVARSFTPFSQQPLDSFFEQWVQGTGAPSLRVHDARATPQGDGFRLTARVEQVQPGPAYRLQIPIAIHMEGVEYAHQVQIAMDGKEYPLALQLPARPGRLDIDPEFDVFRRLDRHERPPAISQVLGAERVLMVLPAAAPRALREGYRALAQSWQSGRLEIRSDDDLTALPSDRAIWLFGWENRFRRWFATALADEDFIDNGDSVRVNATPLRRATHSVVVLARHPSNPAAAIGWVASDHQAALSGLGRKLPHYGQYSYLGFTGDEPTNVVKGQWPVGRSPMSVAVLQADGTPSKVISAKLASRPPLAKLPVAFSAARMLEDIRHLAAQDMAGRGLDTAGLDRAAAYIAEQFRSAGLRPGGDGGDSYFQTWTAEIDGLEHPVKLTNVIAVIPGTNPQWAKQSVVIGAHYDHLGRGWPHARKQDKGEIHPGADDNASGVSVLLEVARVLGNTWRPARTVVFIAFTGEEAGRLGSVHYVKQPPAYPMDKVRAMINLDTIGRLGEQELLVLGSGSASEWAPIFRGAGFATGVPVKSVPNEFGTSDQKSFLDAGIPAVQLFAGLHGDFHRPTDTVDKIDGGGLTKTAAILREALEYLAFRPAPLTSTQKTQRAEAHGQSEASVRQRAVVLGTVPDFTYGGKGVRLSGVIPNTPAATVGLRENDIIVALNGTTISDLRDLAKVLQSLRPNEAVTVRFLRDGTDRYAITRVVER